MAALRVLMVHIDPCIRVLKEAQALRAHGVQLDLLCMKLSHQHALRDVVEHVYAVDNYEALEVFLRSRHTEWDIIHCHNEPNEITAVAILACTARPVIYDCHDMSSMRSTLSENDANIERVCFTHSAGIVHVSEGIKEFAVKKYGPSLSVVLPSYPLASESAIGAKPKLKGNHIVYQGTMHPPGKHAFTYRNYMPMFEQLCEAGVYVHVFPTAALPNSIVKHYKMLSGTFNNICIHKPLPYNELLRTMSQFQWGFSGFNFEDISDANTRLFLNSALPNKFFDYVLAGVCPVVINNKTTAEFATKLGIGYAAQDMDDAVRICTTLPPLPPIADLAAIDMGTQIGRLLALYNAARSNS